MGKKYKITLTEKQMRVTQVAVEEYFRLRMGQDMDFSEDMAALNHDLSADNPNHSRIFAEYISRRDHLRELMRAFFRIAFEPRGYLNEQTDDMLIAQCIWDAIRTARGCNHWGQAMQMGGEPLPEIEEISDGKKNISHHT